MAGRIEITVDELMGINVDLERRIEIRDQTINGLIELNDKLVKENTNLKEQLEYHD